MAIVAEPSSDTTAGVGAEAQSHTEDTRPPTVADQRSHEGDAESDAAKPVPATDEATDAANTVAAQSMVAENTNAETEAANVVGSHEPQSAGKVSVAAMLLRNPLPALAQHTALSNDRTIENKEE